MKRLLSAAVIGLIVAGHLAIPADARVVPDIRGTKCTKLGVSRTVKRVSYTCSKSGRGLVWRPARPARGSASTTTTAVTTTSSIVPRRTAAQVVAEKINTHVASMRKRNQTVPLIEYRFGASVGETDRALTRQLAEAFFKYGSFPQLANYRNAISVSLSDEEAVLTTAPWQNIANWGPIAGGYTGTGTYSLVVENFTSHRCGRGATVDACTARSNGGDLGHYRVRVNVLHEFSHGGKVALMGFNPTQVNRNLERMPYWFASGISNIQGAMLLAVIDDRPYSNPNISASEGNRCLTSPISLTSIQDQTTGGGSCRGTGTGDFANELLVARFGLEHVLEFVRESGQIATKDQWSNWYSAWSPTFIRLFLQSPQSFERDVETYRTAVIAGTSLPDDFLDAKERT